MKSLPLVSLFCFCKNRARTIRQAIDSMVNQTYQHIEIIVQDGASTDGTLEILQEYGENIKLVSCPDSGPEEAFWVSLRRCTGEFIGSCQSDEELLPHSVQNAVLWLQKKTEAGVIHGDVFMADEDGEIIRRVEGEPFDLKQYMYGCYHPKFSSSFFRRSALDAVGLHSRVWNKECNEFELWSRLGLQFPLIYIPEVFSKYGSSKSQLSQNPSVLFRDFQARVQLIPQLFKEYPLLLEKAVSAEECIIHQGAYFVVILDMLYGKNNPYSEKILSYIQKVYKAECQT